MWLWRRSHRVVFLLCLSMQGCTVNHHPLIGSVTYLRNEADTGRAIHLQAWGFHLSTSSIDGGLYLGHVEQVVLFAGGASRADDRRRVDAWWTNRNTMMQPVHRLEGESWPLQSPVALCSRRWGIGMRLTRGLGLEAGWSASDAIVLHGDAHLLLLLHSSRQNISDRETIHFSLKEVSP